LLALSDLQCFLHETRTYDTPPTKEIEEILRRRLVDDQVREYIYFTCDARDSSAIEIFIELLESPPENAPKDHPRRKAQVSTKTIGIITTSRLTVDTRRHAFLSFTFGIQRSGIFAKISSWQVDEPVMPSLSRFICFDLS
jgi:hypothetical protein